MSHDTPPVFRPLGRFAPVAVNSGLRPETHELTTLKLVIAAGRSLVVLTKTVAQLKITVCS